MALYDPLEERLQDHDARIARIERLQAAKFACDRCTTEYTSAAAAARCDCDD